MALRLALQVQVGRYVLGSGLYLWVARLTASPSRRTVAIHGLAPQATEHS
jgi:hypothetical protein